jgi:hypothetical protein
VGLVQFSQSVANNSVKYQHEIEGYVIEPSYDISGESAFLAVSRVRSPVL